MLLIHSVEQMKQVLANAAWEAYDVGDAIVAEANGWEWIEGGSSMSRVFFIEAPERADADGGQCSRKMTFTVLFKSADSANIKEVYALTDMGEYIGTPVVIAAPTTDARLATSASPKI